MHLRTKFINLESYGNTNAFRVPIKGVAWSMRIENTDQIVLSLIENIPVNSFSNAFALATNVAQAGYITLDFPPVVVNGTVVPYDFNLLFTPDQTVGNGIFRGVIAITELIEN